MRIAIVWAHGTGKTTLLKELSKWYSWKIITEIARDVMQDMWKIPQEMTKEELISFQRKIYTKQYSAEMWVADFLSDRGIYDNLAYAYNVDKHLFHTLRDHAMQNHKWYDKTIYLPIEFDLVWDWVRFEDRDFQKKIDNDLLSILSYFWVEVMEVRGTVQERKDFILQNI